MIKKTVKKLNIPPEKAADAEFFIKVGLRIVFFIILLIGMALVLINAPIIK